ncbi:MAG TPA: hypothetical protein VKV03_00460 [Candidatus Binataceae bacterium]|nr:hypothetical protein [Candidatus Binataceae bacterium]
MWWVRFSDAKIKNPLFSATWWVRLCNFASLCDIAKMTAAPISGAANIMLAPFDLRSRLRIHARDLTGEEYNGDAYGGAADT